MIGNDEVTPKPQQAGASHVNIIKSAIGNTGQKRSGQRQIFSERFLILKKLGQGTYGTVQLAIDNKRAENVALKTIKKNTLEPDSSLERKRREMRIMLPLQHPNIIRIHEVLENREKIVLVMEFAPNFELFTYLDKHKVLSEDEARKFFRQISAAIYYCHKNYICHRDLKLENILLDINMNIKITDFGLSRIFEDQQLLSTFCGSQLYAAPEIATKVPYLGPPVDCWSLGVLLYIFVYGNMPFGAPNPKLLVTKICNGIYEEPEHRSTASSFIKRMLTVCPQKRATIEDICNHHWINIGYSESCLDVAQMQAIKYPMRLASDVETIHEVGDTEGQLFSEGLGSRMLVKKQIEADPVSVQPKRKICEIGVDVANQSTKDLAELLNSAKTVTNNESLVDKTEDVAVSKDNKDSQEKLENELGKPVYSTSYIAAVRTERKSVRFQNDSSLPNSMSNPEQRRYPSVLCCISGPSTNNDQKALSTPVATETITKSPESIIRKSCLKSATLPKSTESSIRKTSLKYATLPLEKDD